MKSYAPARKAASTISMLPKAVMTSTGTSGQRSVTVVASSRPVVPPRLTSVTRTSTEFAAIVLERVRCGGRLEDLEATPAQCARQDLTCVVLVVDEQDGWHDASTCCQRS